MVNADLGHCSHQQYGGTRRLSQLWRTALLVNSVEIIFQLFYCAFTGVILQCVQDCFDNYLFEMFKWLNFFLKILHFVRV